jgi:endo-1,4-beta-mannosidase
MFNHWWTQVSANSSLKEVKQRLIDSLISAGINITVNDVRLWLNNDGLD